MQFEPPLIPARLIKRYKRFLADVELLDGSLVTAHCANPGAMTGLKDEGQEVWLQPATNPARKLKFSWILVDHGREMFTGVDTSLPNRLVKEALEAKQIGALSNYTTIKPEQKYAENSRIDFLLSKPGSKDLYLEVKSVTLQRQDGLAEFPDTVTARGTKHLHALMEVVRQGSRAMMFYLVQRNDCERVSLARDIDPEYADACKEARKAGVEILSYSCEISPHGMNLGPQLPFLG